MTTTQSADSAARDDPRKDTLSRLREREVMLLAQAQELQARTAHLMRVRNAHQNRLARNVDGLGACRLTALSSSKRRRFGYVSQSFGQCFVDL